MTNQQWGWSRRLRPLLIGLLLAGGIGVAGCSSPRNALGPPESPCFRALPAARAAVSNKGRFDGVRYLSSQNLRSSLREVEHHVPRSVTFPHALVVDKSAVCAVAYVGHFDSRTVAEGWSAHGTTGTLAIVVVRVPDDTVIATVVTRSPPLPFSRFLPSLV